MGDTVVAMENFQIANVQDFGVQSLLLLLVLENVY